MAAARDPSPLPTDSSLPSTPPASPEFPVLPASCLVSPDSTECPTEVEAVLQSAAEEMAADVTVDCKAQAAGVERDIEEMLMWLEEFCGILDVVRQSSGEVFTHLPAIQSHAAAMRTVYSRIDRLEVFVKVAAKSVAGLETAVTRAERELSGPLPRTLRGLLRSISVPTFRTGTGPREEAVAPHFEAPPILCTDDFFPSSDWAQQ
uniref:biogenesis of lysosome-related organelles complex 1 subunit 4-like n=1 Tax=Myxine glutinosa TaxID=7769 RepID=UPI00358EA95F